MPGKAVSRKDDSQRPVASRDFLSKLDMAVDDSSDFNYIDSAINSAANAEGIDALFAALGGSGILSGKNDMVGVEHTVHSFDVKRGDIESSQFKYYLIVRAALLSNGREVEYSIGAPNCVILLFTLEERGQLPVNVVIREKSTANGELLYMERVADRAIPLTVQQKTDTPIPADEPPF